MPLSSTVFLSLAIASLAIAVCPGVPRVSAAEGFPSEASSLPLSVSVPRVQASPQAQVDTTQPAPTPIPASEIARRSEEARATLRRILGRLGSPDVLDRVEAQLPETEASITRLREETTDPPLNELSFRRLEDIRQQWVRLERQIEGWQRTLENRSSLLDEERANLGTLQDTWEVTDDSAAAGGVPEPVREQVGAVLSLADSVATLLEARRERLLAAVGRVSQQSVAVEEVLTRLEAAQSSARRRLLSPDSPFLWQALGPSADTSSFTLQLERAWERNARAVREFRDDYGDRAALHLVLFLVLILLAWWLEQGTERWLREDERLASTAHVLRRPASSALIVALLLTRWLYPRAPIAIYDLATLFMLVPVLRLLPGVIAEGMRAPLYGLAGLFVLDRMVSLTSEQTLLGRLLLLALTGFTLGGLLWVVRMGGRKVLRGSGQLGKTAIFFSRLGLLVLAVSLVANVVGNVLLAQLLTGATIRSAILGVVLYAGVLVLGGLISVTLRTRAAGAFRAIRHHRPLIHERLLALLRWVAVGVWVWVTLELFQLRDLLVREISAILSRSLDVGTLSLSLGDVLIFGLVLWLSWLISRVVRFVLQEDVLPRLELPRGVPGTISMMANYVILGIGFVIAVGAAGIDWSRFAIVAGALGVGIGFGLQNVVNNFVSGLILVFERPVKVGDMVEVGTLLGEVRRIGIRASTVRTLDGAEVIVPNGHLISNEVVNWTLSDRQRRISVDVGVRYGTEPERVLDLLEGVARDHPEVLDVPEPNALFQEFGDSALIFTLRCWTGEFVEYFRVRSELTVAVNARLKDAGLEIPFPQRDLHLRTIGGTEPIGGGDGRAQSARPRDEPSFPGSDDE